ncbi:MAG TPA: alpha-glucosidase family protein [Aliidongia sp.]|nr:alpha-glucosidase family protein [Aliidongia sp.]
MSDKLPWWHGAVIYQIYPRSFLDTDGDGIGDLAGIERRLDHIAALGADAIWLSPIYPSPNRDYGYDVADYRSVAPEMGSLAGFDRLVAAAHRVGLRVILDQVLSHSSDQHPWFLESAASRDNAKADWYVWADAREDGGPPNNWLAAFGGAAWSWSPQRRQYYHHKFLRQQPKLNFHQPAVAAAMLDVLRFWLDRGVDGFRLDVANSYIHDPALRDNPPVPMAERIASDWQHPPRLQRHLRDANMPENEAVMLAVRQVMDGYGDRFVFGEFSEEPSMFGRYAGGDRLHSGYTFGFLEDRSFNPRLFRTYYVDLLAAWPDLWPCVTFSNHDVMRPVTRWGGGEGDDDLAKLGLTLLLALKGTVLLYQGEELGLAEAELDRRDLHDPFGDLYYPHFKGRDGCRTPMPWDGSPSAGFTSGTPWLPIPSHHRNRSVAAQIGDAGSVLHHARRMIALRRRYPALIHGGIRFLDLPEPVLGFVREAEGERILCVFNLGREPARCRLPAFGPPIFGTGGAELAPRSALLAPLA